MNFTRKSESTRLRAGLQVARRVADDLGSGLAELRDIAQRGDSDASDGPLNDLVPHLDRARQAVLATIEQIEPGVASVQLPLFPEITVS